MFAKLVFCTIFFLISKIALAEVELDYYWVDTVAGKIPENAIKVEKGECDCGYIGQVYYPDSGIYPAEVFSTKPYAVFAAQNETKEADTFIKVLCSQFPTGFQWVKTDITKYKQINNPVLGGAENDTILHIGRASKSHGVVLGKIGTTFTIPYDDREMEMSEFEILIYNKMNHY